MSGAYVAKPAVVVPLVIPPGWNPDWTFPGPSPPGYTPDYIMALAADSTIAPGGATQSVALSLHDGELATVSPAGSSIWTATMDGAPLKLGLAGGSLANSVTSAFSTSGGIWGSAPSFFFNISNADDGKTIVLKSAGTPFGSAMSQTANITVESKVVISIIFTATATSRVDNTLIISRITALDKGDTAAGGRYIFYEWPYGLLYYNDLTYDGPLEQIGTICSVLRIPDDVVVVTAGTTKEETDDNYSLWLNVTAGNGVEPAPFASADFTAEIFRDDELLHSYSISVTQAGCGRIYGDWIRYNVLTDVVTLLDLTEE